MPRSADTDASPAAGARPVTFDDVCGRLRSELGAKLPADVGLSPDTALADLPLSSLQMAELMFTLEEEYGLEFDPERLVELARLGDLVTLVNESPAAGAWPPHEA